jgi:hypothetical protein
MAEHPILMSGKKFNILVNKPGQTQQNSRESVVSSAPKVSDGKPTVAQRLSKYAFGEEVAEPGKYIWSSYLEPTGKRVANDIVEYFLQMIKHTFQRWIWNGKILDDGKYKDRTSYSNGGNWNGNTGPIKAAVMMSPVKELTFETKLDAENVLKELQDTIVSDGGAVTVRTYYEAAGVPELCEANGVSSKSGWTDLSKAEIKAQPDGGFCITLPRPKSLSQN